MRRIGDTDLEVFELNLGGNVFGWTADERQSFAVLDAYAAAGGNFIDTADVYPVWAPGCSGGESETIIGRWMTSRGNRDQMIIATKVCAHPQFRGLSAANIPRAAEASLRRLGTDRIDIYYAHYDDPRTQPAETMRAFGGLVRQGKVRYLGASNFDAQRLIDSQQIARQAGTTGYAVIQPCYNLMELGYELSLAPVAEREHLACLPYPALASGFLTGKYRGSAEADSPRAEDAHKYSGKRGSAVLDKLAELAAGYGVCIAAIALAWLAARPTVAAPIASARTPEQLKELLAFTDVSLTPDQIALLAHVAGPDGGAGDS